MTPAAEYLAVRGHTCRVFSDPRQALPAITEAPPDIVLTDLMMPWMDGLEL